MTDHTQVKLATAWQRVPLRHGNAAYMRQGKVTDCTGHKLPWTINHRKDRAVQVWERESLIQWRAHGLKGGEQEAHRPGGLPWLEPTGAQPDNGRHELAHVGIQMPHPSQHDEAAVGTADKG
eukprot:14910620-Alexandrium_andersonii.AAC.1